MKNTFLELIELPSENTLVSPRALSEPRSLKPGTFDIPLIPFLEEGSLQPEAPGSTPRLKTGRTKKSQKQRRALRKKRAMEQEQAEAEKLCLGSDGSQGSYVEKQGGMTKSYGDLTQSWAVLDRASSAATPRDRAERFRISSTPEEDISIADEVESVEFEVGSNYQPEQEPVDLTAPRGRSAATTSMDKVGVRLEVDLHQLQDHMDPRTRMIQRRVELDGLPFDLKFYPEGHGYSEAGAEMALFVEGPTGYETTLEVALNDTRLRQKTSGGGTGGACLRRTTAGGGGESGAQGLRSRAGIASSREQSSGGGLDLEHEDSSPAVLQVEGETTPPASVSCPLKKGKTITLPWCRFANPPEFVSTLPAKVRDLLEEIRVYHSEAAARRGGGVVWDAERIKQTMGQDPKNVRFNMKKMPGEEEVAESDDKENAVATDDHEPDGADGPFFLREVRERWGEELALTLGHADELVQIEVLLLQCRREAKTPNTLSGITMTTVEEKAPGMSLAMEEIRQEVAAQVRQQRAEEESAARRIDDMDREDEEGQAGASSRTKQKKKRSSSTFLGLDSDTWRTGLCAAATGAAAMAVVNWLKGNRQTAKELKAAKEELAQIRNEWASSKEGSASILDHVQKRLGKLELDTADEKYVDQRLKAFHDELDAKLRVVDERFSEKVNESAQARDAALAKAEVLQEVRRGLVEELAPLQERLSRQEKKQEEVAHRLQEKPSTKDVTKMVEKTEKKLDGRQEQLEKALGRKADKNDVEVGMANASEKMGRILEQVLGGAASASAPDPFPSLLHRHGFPFLRFHSLLSKL